LKTNDHFSSNWTSRVRGGKSHELVVELLGVRAGEPAVVNHRVAVHSDEPAGRPNTAPLGEVLKERDDLVHGELGAKQGRPFPLGESAAAPAAVEQTILLLFTVPGADRQIAGATLAVVGAVLVLAAEAGKVVIPSGTAALVRAANRQSAGATRFVVRAVLILGAEAGKGVIHGGTSEIL
jgi:hypothetical protein